MKRMIFAITVAVTLFCTCGSSTAPEERGQDERLFGRSAQSVRRPGMSIWINHDLQQDILFFKYTSDGNDSTLTRLSYPSYGRSVSLYSYNWYTIGNNIYIRNIVGQEAQRPYGENVSYQYHIDGDTLTLGGGPASGALAQFGGKYIYLDIDAFCDTAGPC